MYFCYAQYVTFYKKYHMHEGRQFDPKDPHFFQRQMKYMD